MDGWIKNIERFVMVLPAALQVFISALLFGLDGFFLAAVLKATTGKELLHPSMSCALCWSQRKTSPTTSFQFLSHIRQEKSPQEQILRFFPKCIPLDHLSRILSPPFCLRFFVVA